MERIAVPSLLVLAMAMGCANDRDSAHDIVSEKSQPMTEQADAHGTTMPTYPSTDEWSHANEKQKARAKRSFVELRMRHVPVYHGPLFVNDEDRTTLQTPQDVALRTLVLWAVELRAEGVPRAEAREIVDNLDLWEYVSADEKRFLDDETPSPEECQKLVWRLESLWVLMWSLGYIDELDWPNGMCDVSVLAGMIAEIEDDPEFITSAKLRSATEILDAQDLIMRIHWAARDAYLHQGGTIPEELDWSSDPDYVPATVCAGGGVVEQRHKVLNWLVNYLSPESWDDVDTPA